MKIGVISDTHGHLDEKVFDYFKDCDEIWHGGDIGDIRVADQLKQFKPFRAVHGNIDDKQLQVTYPEDQWFECEGLHVWITHIGGVAPSYNPRIRKILEKRQPDIFICGHSHILKIGRDSQHNNLLFLNPGAAGNEGFHKIKTIVRFELIDRQIKNMEVIELGKRGSISS
jgi:uncharacterized protein